MSDPENYQVNYWAGKETYTYEEPKKPRSIKRKLFIVFCFITVLAITPTLIYTLSNLEFDNSSKLTVVNTPEKTPQIKEPESFPVTITEPTKTADSPSITKTEVLNNDSYWKISKRVCGTGKYYISVQTQNLGKALYEGDTVSVSCVL